MIRLCDVKVIITFHFFFQLQVQYHSLPSVQEVTSHQLNRDLPALRFFFIIFFSKTCNFLYISLCVFKSAGL